MSSLCSEGDGESIEAGSEACSDEEDQSGRRLTPTEKVKAVKVLDKRLRKRSFLYTNHAIHKYFRKYAATRKPDGSLGVNPAQAAQMAPEVAAYLEIPAVIFKQVSVLFERFDFDSTGVLDKSHCTALFRSMLRQKRKDLGGRTEEVAVPTASVSDKGYKVDKELGRGGQGVMYLCSKRGASRPYCIKFYAKGSEDEDDDLQDLINEYTLMKDLSSDHVAKTYEVFQDSTYFYLVNEPYFGGDLTKLGKRAHDEGVSMSENWWRQLFWQCLEGLRYLHSNGIMHCDIKEENMMVAEEDGYQEPRVVLIDFGLAEAFASTAAGASGTPGYIPPETWETEWWYPRGDVFSMGIAFFQLMIGQVPTDDVLGILQSPGEREDDKALCQALVLPWSQFPSNMPLLRELVGKMTQRNFRQRPSAAAALEHAWFASQSDAELPAASRAALVGCSAAQCVQEQVMQELAKGNNLQELRSLQDDFEEADPSQLGRVPAEKAVELLKAYHVRKGCAKEFVSVCAAPDGSVQYRSLMAECVRLKEHYARQFIKDLFRELDVDSSGTLSTSELSILLNGVAFECPYEDIGDLMAEMDTNRDGSVSFSEFTEAVLNDGRIARRSEVENGGLKLALCGEPCTIM